MAIPATDPLSAPPDLPGPGLRPQEKLQSPVDRTRRIVAEDGLVVVADMNVAPEFDPDAGDLERLMYGFSNFLCLPDGKAHGPTAATGTVMRPSRLRDCARKAGFGNIEELPIETDFWKFYKLI